MNRIYVYNSGLETQQQESISIEIYGLNTASLIAGDWLLSNEFPTYKLIDLYRTIRRVSPIKWGDNIKFWDMGGLGYGIYNHAYNDWTQVIEE